MSFVPVTWVRCGCNRGAKGGLERVGGYRSGWLLDTGGHWVDVVAGGHRAGGGERLQGCDLPLWRRLAVNGGGGWTVSTLYSYWYREQWGELWERGKDKRDRKDLRVRKTLCSQGTICPESCWQGRVEPHFIFLTYHITLQKGGVNNTRTEDPQTPKKDQCALH